MHAYTERMARKKLKKKKRKLKKLPKTFTNIPLRGGSHLRSALPSTAIALSISMSALQKSNISAVNQNDMIIKQKRQVFIVNFF